MIDRVSGLFRSRGMHGIGLGSNDRDRRGKRKGKLGFAEFYPEFRFFLKLKSQIQMFLTFEAQIDFLFSLFSVHFGAFIKEIYVVFQVLFHQFRFLQ